MNTDIKLFCEGIRTKTGINFSVYDMSGELVAGQGELVDNAPLDFDGIMVDAKKNVTCFDVKFKGKRFVAVIKGSGKTEMNYAFLICELAENAFSKEIGLNREEFLRSALLGDINFSQTVRYAKKFSVPNAPAFIMLVSLDSKTVADVQAILRTYIDADSGEIVVIDEGQFALIKFIDNQTEDYQSSTEYAEFLVRTVYEETGVQINISIGGTVKSISGLAQSYQQALMASRMSNALSGRGQVHSFKEYILSKMLEDLPKYRLGEYLEMLMDTSAKEIFEDEEMVSTAEEFLENSLNVSETSRNLYLHRNTLAYRLDKIEKNTGLNIRKFSDAVTFRLITILSKLAR